MTDRAGTYDHLEGAAIATLRALRMAAGHVREVALERGDDALAAREAAHLVALEARIRPLEGRHATASDGRPMPEEGEE